MSRVGTLSDMRRRQQARNRAVAFSRSSPANIDLSNMAEQPDCVLFTAFPAEIRTRIFEHALAPYDDPAKPYRRDRVYWRPSHRFHPRTDVALLRTCKRVFAEARLMPVAEAAHTFWIFGGPWMTMRTKADGMARWDAWQDSLSEAQRAAVRRVHVFAQQVFLEDLGGRPGLGPMRFAARTLRLTLRSTDWWSWESPAESSDRLGICPWLPGRVPHQAMLAQPLRVPNDELRGLMRQGTWGWQICQVQGLQRLEIEFEIDAVKKEQLQMVLDRAKYWVFPLGWTNAALVQSGEVVESEWEGAAQKKDDNYHALQPAGLSPAQETKTYYVATMTWKAVSELSEEYLANATAGFAVK